MNVRPKGVTAIVIIDIAISVINIIVAILFFLPSSTYPGLTLGEQMWLDVWVQIPFLGGILDALLSWAIIGYGVYWGIFYLVYGILGIVAANLLWKMKFWGQILTGALAILKLFYGYGLLVTWYLYETPIEERFMDDIFFCPHCDREMDPEYLKVTHECNLCGQPVDEKYIR
jgi:hypothetical protein